jgi:type II secretory pathway component GspD/PulD (secretin)
MSVPEDTLTRLRAGQGWCRPGATVTGLDDAQVRRFLDRAQSDPRCNLMQAPKVTVFDGQTATFDGMEKRTVVASPGLTWENGDPVHVPKTMEVPVGMSFSVRPAVAADRRSVRLGLKAEVCDAEPANRPYGQPQISVLRVNTTAELPDGRSTLIDAGPRERTVTPEPVPVLSDLPVVGPWLQAAGTRSQVEHVLVMVTPRIIVPEEQEERQIGYRTPPPAQAPSDGDRGADVADLLRRYEAACAAGRAEEATALAVRALALDPACFSSSAKGKRDR